jgi:predicted DNA-binding transcriptional regulator YafY
MEILARKDGVIDGKYSAGVKKIERVMLLIRALNNGKFTLLELAKMLRISERSTYRYLHLLQALKFEIECDFNWRYFIVKGECPICGDNHKNN